MGNVRIEWNNQGFKDILRSDGVKELVLNTAEAIAERATNNIPGPSEGYSASAKQNPSRWVAGVITTDQASIVAESEDKALSRAV